MQSDHIKPACSYSSFSALRNTQGFQPKKNVRAKSLILPNPNSGPWPQDMRCCSLRRLLLGAGGLIFAQLGIQFIWAWTVGPKGAEPDTRHPVVAFLEKGADRYLLRNVEGDCFILFLKLAIEKQ